MIQTSILIPQRNAAQRVATQLTGLCDTLDELGEPYEIIVVDDASGAEDARKLRELQHHFACLRVIRISKPLGVSAAMTAALASAFGKTIVVVEAGNRYPPQEVCKLLAALVRADMVFGRRRMSPTEKAWHRIARIPRWLLLGRDVHEPGAVFWAARSEALAGIELARGMYRYLACFVTMRGYRVSEVYVETRPEQGRPLPDAWPHPGDLLCAWWLKRRWRPFSSQELLRDEGHAENWNVVRVEPSPTKSQDPKESLFKRKSA